ncbi:MAG: DVU0298 family protein [Thermodesulfobacteriota bacterium]
MQADDFGPAADMISQYRPRQVINALISLFCDPEPLLRWRAIAAAGRVVAEHGRNDLESARVIMRRLMWMLNDESGGIGWGVPEAMGAIMAQNERLADEFAAILLSYIHPAANFLEHPILQRGVLWGLGRLAHARPAEVGAIAGELQPFLQSPDSYHRGYAAWTAGRIGARQHLPLLEALTRDEALLDIFADDVLWQTTVAALARMAISES